ncbi:hypothetical protein V2B08_30895, partial [Pseudomonas aeruginosa]
EFGIGHRGNTVPERSGVALSFCGRPVKHVDNNGEIAISLDDSRSYDSENWEDGIYEKQLRKFIEDFISYAESHGGF